MSERVVDQRLRNRIRESLAEFAQGEPAVRRLGAGEWFETFYEVIPHRDYLKDLPLWHPSRNTALSEDEVAAVLRVSAVVDDACDATSDFVTPDELIASGWVDRVKSIAVEAVHVFERRGPLSEDVEEWER